MFSKAKTGRLDIPKKERNHNGATFLCDVTAEEILKSGNDCLNPAHNCRGSVSGTKFTEYDSMPTDSMFKRGQKSLLKKAIDGCKLSLTNKYVRGFSNKVDSGRNMVKSGIGSLRSRFGRPGGKSRRKRRKSRKKKRRKSKKKSRRRRKKSRRRRRR
tara:strand:+ start:2727 stop:3197 length:471 start_codon:yes stop_codon:yes gene_type:complete